MVLIEVYPNGREIERDDGHPRKITYYEVPDPDVIEWLRWGDEESKIERRRRRKAYHSKAARIARHTEALLRQAEAKERREIEIYMEEQSRKFWQAYRLEYPEQSG
jgi:superfamily II DNA or RNA helicase